MMSADDSRSLDEAPYYQAADRRYYYAALKIQLWMTRLLGILIILVVMLNMIWDHFLEEKQQYYAMSFDMQVIELQPLSSSELAVLRERWSARQKEAR